MKLFSKIFLAIALMGILLNSCRKEEIESIQTPPENLLVANSEIANLMQKVSINDGSKDNIVHKSNCFNIKLPINVSVNGAVIALNSKEDYKIIEYIFDEDDDDNDEIIISFPISIILDNFTEKVITDYTELSNYSNLCGGENETDDDIECLDFQYPITSSQFNKNNELINTITLNSDQDLFQFIDAIDENIIAAINFPISVVLFDGTEMTINNLTELKNSIDTHGNDCDEDDDYDYNDDDCNDCNTEQLTTLLTNCNGWTVDKLKRYDTDYNDYYDGHTFSFSQDGVIVVTSANGIDYGTWAASGSANNLMVVVNIPNLPYCNNNWVLQEISEYTETKIDFKVGYGDRLRYENNCN